MSPTFKLRKEMYNGQGTSQIFQIRHNFMQIIIESKKWRFEFMTNSFSNI